MNESDFKEACRMIDAEEEPEQGDPLRTEYWELLERYENFLQREMWIGDDKDNRFEMNIPLKKGLAGNPNVHRQQRQRQDLAHCGDDSPVL